MILILEIDKIASGAYRAAAMSAGVAVTESNVYSGLEDAVRNEALAVPPGFAHFVEVRYAGFSSGTFVLEEIAGRAGEIADQLVALVAMEHAQP
ncbi:MAG: hypothetical protein WAW69_15960 [Polaromonas sp.]